MSTHKNKITPLGDRVLVKPVSADESKKTESGIIIPETVDKEKPEQGEVLAVGEGRVTDEGKVIPVKVKLGDTVIFSKYGPDEIKVDGEEYYIIGESSILAIVN
ncbi:MAG: co-chaperone GroES [Patescibacteria group bacterium]|nr:MAG: co-chaperone GroES [Patescibacteria group bacterium]